MKTSDFTSTLLLEQSPEEAFNAINNVRAWWSEDIEGNTNQLNEEWNYHYEDVHRCKMKILELIPNKKVVWEVIDNYFSFTKDKREWTGNKIIFDISDIDNKTKIQFTHIGLVPEYECYEICQNAWSTYIQKSLYSLITTGKGQPNAKSETKKDFSTTILVDQTAKEVFNAINNVRGWWQGEIEGNSEILNDEFSYQMLEFHYSKQRVVELDPNKKIVWLITDSKLNFLKDKTEWTGTKICFEISQINNKTQIRFTHLGLVPTIECYGACSNGWEQLVQKSLFSFITTGKGKKVF